MRPTAKTATPEVAEPISSKQLATTAGKSNAREDYGDSKEGCP
jgi:hypothetical protein